jgi:hypothetical protein
VSKSWVPDDQSIPGSLQARVVRRDGSQPTVKAVAIDTDFDAVDRSNAGKVNIAIQGIRKNPPGKILQFFEKILLATKILIFFAILAKFPEA